METLTAASPQPMHKLLHDFHKGKRGNITSDLWRNWVWSLRRNLRLKVKKSNRLLNNFTHASHFFVHFFAITAWLWRESAQFYILWKEKHKTTTFLFSPWTLIESSEFNSRKMFCLTNESTKKVEKNILTAQDTTGPGFLARATKGGHTRGKKGCIYHM